MSEVIIYRPAKNAMQSGRANTRRWVVEFPPGAPRRADSVMGWIGSGDTRAQVRLRFDSREEAIAYAERNDLSYRLAEPHPRRVIKKSYADRFRWDRAS